jgi:hypothetical protein
MKYPEKWKGRVRVNTHGHVFWDGKKVGHVYNRYRAGFKTPGGMQTNTVFFVTGRDTEYPTARAAIGSLLPAEAQLPEADR